jgi:hypothetical protein
VRSPGHVHLTFDDGPDPVWTPRIAAELERLGTRGTFFVVGEQAARHPEVVRELVAAGHEVELHCMRHEPHAESARAAVEADTGEAMELLRSLGARPRWWRPPGGRLASWTRAVGHDHGLRLAGWSSDPRDWDGEMSGFLLLRIAPDLAPGSVVVMHDGALACSPREDCSQTAALIESLVGNVRARGWEPGPLGDGAGAWLRWDRPQNAALRARRRLRNDVPGRPFEVEVASEDDLTAADFADLRALLTASMTRLGPEYGERAYRRLRPDFRTVARIDGRIVGTLSAFLIRTDPERRLYAFGDLAVADYARGRGISDRVATEAATEVLRREPEVVLADTVAHRPRDLRLGLAPVPRFRFWYERDGACHWHPQWLAMIRHPEPQVRLQLEEGDF